MMMRCAACGRNLKGNQRKCPRCGEPVAEKLAGVLKTSTILISADDIDGVYRSVQDVPEPLRKKLLRTTNGINSRTILIADRRGRAVSGSGPALQGRDRCVERRAHRRFVSPGVGDGGRLLTGAPLEDLLAFRR